MPGYVFKNNDKTYDIAGLGTGTLYRATRWELEALMKDIQMTLLDEDVDDNGKYIGGIK